MEKCDVLLINPPFNLLATLKSGKQSHQNKESQIYCYPPLGISYLASSLIKAGFKTKIIDSVGSRLNITEICSKVNIIKPKIIGITVTSNSLNSSFLLIKELKKEFKEKIIVGGPHITYDPKSFEYLNADFGFIGEGEESMVKLANVLIREKKVNIRRLSKIAGLIYKHKDRTHFNKRAYIKNLDSLSSPARELLPNKNYFFSLHGGKFTTIITSRGCIFDCVYCALPDKHRIRIRSIENVIEEIRMLLKKGYTYIDFQDDFLTFDRERTRELCNLITKKNMKFSWGCATRVEFVDKDLLELMHKAGCHNIRYGIESGSERVRKVIGKNFSDKKIIDVFRLTKGAGIATVAFFSLGHPTETKKDILRTYSLSKKIAADYIQFVLINILPGSMLFKIAISKGLINKDIWKDVCMGETPPTFIPEFVSLEYMRRIQRRALIGRYLNPIYSIKNLFASTDIKDFRNKISIGLAILKNFVK